MRESTAQPAPDTGPIEIVVDHRERAAGLVDALMLQWPHVAVGTLEIGDVAVGPRVRVERKTVHDLAVSLEDGRLFRQLWGLCGACPRPLLVVEGRDSWPVAGISPEALRGALLSVTLGYRVPILRTMDVSETAVYLAAAAAREERRRSRGRRPPRTSALEVLAAVPGVGDHRARELLRGFGTVEGVFSASPDQLAQVPGIGSETARRIRAAGGAGDAAGGTVRGI